MQEKGRKKNQEKRIILAFLREEAGILLWVVFFIGIFWLLCFLEDLPRVFERGYTGYNGRTDKRSTGIGLYLCRQIMDRLSHTIRIESEMGVGTRVYLGLDTVEL